MDRWTVRVPWRRLTPLLPMLVCTPLFWSGGSLAMLGLLILTFSMLILQWRGQRGGWAQPIGLPDQGRSVSRGAAPMISQIIPIWSRQMNATRDSATDGVQGLLQAFNQIYEDLADLVEPHGGAFNGVTNTDGILSEVQPALEMLTSTAERSHQQAAQAQAQLGQCAEIAKTNRKLASTLGSISRHTRLVAFNAAIEARRVDAAVNAGFVTLAEEVKRISMQLEEMASSADERAAALDTLTQHALLASALNEGVGITLRQEVNARAKEAVVHMLASMGHQVGTGRQWQGRAAAVKARIDEIYVHFQFGDRISQMLELVSTNMETFVQWQSAHPNPTQADIDQWLSNLEASYSMEEQRAHHHGNVHVDTSAGVEFF
jgi:methyl-accepting chemotaxis protein